MNKPLRVLLAEDSQDDALILVRDLRRAGYDVRSERVETPEAFQAALAAQPWDIVIADWHMPNFSAPAAFELLKETGLDLPFIILSGVVGEEEAVAAMKAGAHDYIRKGNPARLIPAIDRELRDAELRRNHRRLEAALEQSQKMQVFGRFAGQIATEFRDAVVTITELSASVLEQLPSAAPVQRDIESIHTAAERAGLLTQQLLSLSRAQPAEPKLLDLNTVITDSYDLLRHVVGKNVRLKTVLDPALGTVLSDRSQLEQLLLNLIVNARDATAAGGTITIETSNVELDSSYAPQLMEVSPGRYVVVAVTDTGCGIERSVLTRIFEPFFSTKPAGRGVGLGLAFVYNITKQHGGDIRVTSEPGVGSTFGIYLPRAEGELTTDSPAVAELVSRPTRTILLVEHDAGIRAVARETLSGAGYGVLEASDGRTARLITKNFRNAVHLLVAGVVLTDMSGHELAAELSLRYPGLRVMFFYSGSDLGDAAPRGSRMIDRHCQPKALLEAVDETLAAELTSEV